jgi:hypothetical protein
MAVMAEKEPEPEPEPLEFKLDPDDPEYAMLAAIAAGTSQGDNVQLDANGEQIASNDVNQSALDDE